MPGFEESALCRAPADGLWALLYDPARFPDWWVGTARTEATPAGATRYLHREPDVPVSTAVRAVAQRSRVIISCLVADYVWEWTLEADRDGCRVLLRVQVPDDEPHMLAPLREEMRASMRRLVALAETEHAAFRDAQPSGS